MYFQKFRDIYSVNNFVGFDSWQMFVSCWIFWGWNQFQVNMNHTRTYKTKWSLIKDMKFIRSSNNFSTVKQKSLGSLPKTPKSQSFLKQNPASLESRCTWVCNALQCTLIHHYNSPKTFWQKLQNFIK